MQGSRWAKCNLQILKHELPSEKLSLVQKMTGFSEKNVP